jgi:Icc-related predicted phosphoesterase
MRERACARRSAHDQQQARSAGLRPAYDDRGVGISLFVSDLHGKLERYRSLFEAIETDRPDAVFMGGDLLPGGFGLGRASEHLPADFINDVIGDGLARIRERMGSAYPPVFVILGNDDPRFEEAMVLEVATRGLWHYAHGRRVMLGRRPVYGYSYVPPSPFTLKDWERYDVSRYVDPGCVSPEEGMRSVPVAEHDVRYGTILEDLQRLVGRDDVSEAILLCHSPPYETNLDRADLDGKMVDHVPIDVHVGSIALRRFIEARQPRVTLHGHVHESARLTGDWRGRLGRTHMFTAAHDGPELALVRFDPDDPEAATRELI